MDCNRMKRYEYRPSSMMMPPMGCQQPSPMGNQKMPCKEMPPCCDEGMYGGLASLPLAMGYVPNQQFCTTMELCRALQNGTIFPELCKPFYGKRGRMCR